MTLITGELSESISLVDIGLNLAHDSFDHDRDELIARAVNAHVRHMLITGSSISSTQRALQLVQERRDLFRCTAGIHPHHAVDLDADALDQLTSLAQHPDVIAVGECGLDYFRNFSPVDAQRKAFQQQIALAARVGKPIFLHQRDAHEEFVGILGDSGHQLQRGVAHCFTAGLAEARAYLDLGLYIGITGWICDERRGGHLSEVVKYIPQDRLLLETDAPYLLPRDIRPKPSTRRNEPMYLPYVLKALAAARGESIEELAEATTRNARRLFGWPSAEKESSQSATREAQP
jgi:TatD DNase family protein